MLDDGEDSAADESDVTLSGAVGVLPMTRLVGREGTHRLRIMRGEEECFRACFLLYGCANRTVVAPDKELVAIPGSVDGQMAAHEILVYFDMDTVTDAEISALLRAQRLRPTGISRNGGFVVTRPEEDLSPAQLLDLITSLNSSHGPSVVGYGINPASTR